MLRWTLWAATELEPHTISVLYNRVGGRPGAARDETAAMAAIAALKPKFAVLDQRLAAGGGHLSAAVSPSPTSTWPKSSAMRRPRPTCSTAPRA